MKIGALAEQSGVHIETIRYYQTLGLIPRPARARGTVRRYGKEAVDRLRFIKRAQGLGFSLDEVKLLLKLSAGEHCEETRLLAERKRQLVDKKIADLRAIQSVLNDLITACSTGKSGHGCPIIERLSMDERRSSTRR
ncbi:MAG TPA: MerR family transcriptional regulator [Burkholderiales bacterium]|nr:MerR family transcriptional regulator [Burkholderiales bacterium]